MCSTTVHRLQHVRKKVRHVGQSKVMESHFDLVNPYHADFDVELSLCSKNRILAAGYNNKNTQPTKQSYSVYRYGFGDPSDTVCSVWIFESLKNGLNRERRAHAPERFTRFGTRPASVCSVCVHGTISVAQPRFGLVTVCVGAA